MRMTVEEKVTDNARKLRKESNALNKNFSPNLATSLET